MGTLPCKPDAGQRLGTAYKASDKELIVNAALICFNYHYFFSAEEITTKSTTCEIPEDPKFPLCSMKVKVSLNNSF